MGLKILMSTMGLGIGGAETHIVELSKELKRRGFDVVIISNGGVYVSEIEAEGIRHYDAPMHQRSIRCMLRSYRLLKQVIKKEKPDIVHAHARIPAFLCGLLQRKLHFAFVTTAHAVFQLGPGLKLLTNWGQKTISVSDDIRRYLIDNYGIPDADITQTINGIDTQRFSPAAVSDNIMAELGLDPERPVITHVSRIDESSTVVTRLLIELAPELSRAIPGVQILIAGGGNVFSELLSLADDINSKEGRRVIIMLGSRTDIDEIVSVSDLFVGVSRAALEAMAEAKPVIIAGSEGYIGLLTPDNADQAQKSNFCGRGCTMPTGSVLLNEIIRSLQTVSLTERQALGAFCRELVLRNYSVNRMTDDCVAVYDAVRKRRYNVVMSGYYGNGNAGDEAILQAINQNIITPDNTSLNFQNNADVSITVLSSDPLDTKTRYGYNAVNRFHLLAVVRALHQCSALISGGGSLLQDLTSTRSLIYYLMIIYIAELFGKKVMIYANGIGPVRKKFNRILVGHIVGNADVITLRDEFSAHELQCMGVDAKKMRVTADPVFNLRGLNRVNAMQLLQESAVPTDHPFICVSIRAWSRTGTFYKDLAWLCDEIYDRYKLNIVFLPMQTPNDTITSRQVMSSMKRPSFVLEKRYNAEETMGIISLSQLVVAMRLHALIFAARVCVPLVGLVYDPKVTAYIEALGMKSAGDVTAFDADFALQTVASVLDNRADSMETLKKKTQQLEALAREDAELLLELLETNK